MLEQLKRWLRKGKIQPRRPRQRIIPRLEPLEERWCPAGDTYTWNPGAMNLLASNPANWMKNNVQQNANGTLPGQNGNSPNDTVLLDTNTSTKDIEWNQNFTFSTMNIKNNYLGDQTIDKNVTVDLTGDNGSGALNANDGATLIFCADSTSTLKIEANSTISNFNFSPVGNNQVGGTLLIDGGQTVICNKAAGASLWGTVQVWDSTLVDQGQGQLKLLGNTTTIQIYTARMEVDGGAGKTLISENTPGQNDYIDVQNSGELDYLGKGGATDTFTAPVLVEDGGTFYLNGGGGGTLQINGKEQGTNNLSLSCDGTLNLANGITLKTSAGIKATSISTVATLDSSKCTITVASGNPCIMDGTVQIDSAPDSYGTLVVNCDTLNLDGTLMIAIDGVSSNTCDQLIVNGVLALGGGSNLTILEDVSTGNDPESWDIITSTGGAINGFGTSDAFEYNITDGPNEPSSGDYTLDYNP